MNNGNLIWSKTTNTSGSTWYTTSANGEGDARINFPATIGKTIKQLFTDGLLRNGDAALGTVDYTHNAVTGNVDFASTIYPEQIVFIVYA